MGDLGKIIVATGLEWLPKEQKIAQSGHTVTTEVGICLTMQKCRSTANRLSLPSVALKNSGLAKQLIGGKVGKCLHILGNHL